jgi:peptidoglycan/xylan/chitin deacetylase (PgdA/CDA1 family)
MVGYKALSALAAVAGLVSAHPGHGIEKRALPVGQIIEKCTKAGVVALTFDDGPAGFTENLLNQLAASAAGHKATFFINGENYGSIYNYNSTLNRMITEGHQLASHT